MVTFNVNDNAEKEFRKLMHTNSEPDHNSFYKLINAVEIDWNTATLSDANPSNSGSYGPINDTAQLLDLINTMQKEIYILTAAVIALSSKKNYYWYIGVDNPTSISTSDLQTDNTKPGWHDIGTSLSGFRLDTTGGKSNRITLTESDTGVIGYYVIIPDGLDIYDANEDNGYYLFNEIQCNIAGYKAFKYNSQDEIWTVKGIIIK